MEEDTIATASLLLDSSGVHRQIFPKTYHTRVTYGFAAYLIFLTVLLFGYTTYMYFYVEGQMTEWIFLFDAVYMGFVFTLIFFKYLKVLFAKTTVS